MLLIFIGGTTFAFWSYRNFSASSNNNAITVGTGRQVITSVDFSYLGEENYKLVPLGRAANAEPGAVEYVLLVYEVEWTNDDDAYFEGTIYDLIVSIENITPDNEVLQNLLNITYQVGGTEPNELTGESSLSNTNGSIEIDGPKINVYVLVTLDNPESINDYDLIVGETIVFDVKFEVLKPTV